LKAYFNSQLGILGQGVRRFPWQAESAYAEFLAQTYYYVGHSTRLLAASAARLGVEDEKLHHRFLKHTAEERSHHLLASHDLDKLGYALANFPELPTTAAMYECQYFRIEHRDPTALFGYILALEGLSVAYGREVYESALKGFNERACTFLKVHVEEDIEHLETAFSYIETLSETKQMLIRQNLVHSCHLYNVFLDGIASSAALRSGRTES
jgi:hypothetical protein